MMIGLWLCILLAGFCIVFAE